MPQSPADAEMPPQLAADSFIGDQLMEAAGISTRSPPF
jgi:hypothetical protein